MGILVRYRLEGPLSLHLDTGAESRENRQKARSQATESEGSHKGSERGSDRSQESDRGQGTWGSRDSRESRELALADGEVDGEIESQDLSQVKTKNTEDLANKAEHLLQQARDDSIDGGSLAFGGLTGMEVVEQDLETLNDLGGLLGGEPIDFRNVRGQLPDLEASAEGEEEASKTWCKSAQPETGDEECNTGGESSEKARLDSRGLRQCWSLSDLETSFGPRHRGSKGGSHQAEGGGQDRELHCEGGVSNIIKQGDN
jgi:hypothetical protein